MGGHYGDLSERLEQRLNGPMILISLCVIPLLVLDYYQPEHHPLVHHLAAAANSPIPPAADSSDSPATSQVPAALASAQLPAVRFATRIGEALIWTAFALEFTVMIAVIDRKLKYCLKHWIDILVIVLPLVAFMRSLRLARFRGSIRSANSRVCIACAARSCGPSGARSWCRLSNAGCFAIRKSSSPGFGTRSPRKSANSKPCAGKSAISNGRSSDKLRRVAASLDARRKRPQGASRRGATSNRGHPCGFLGATQRTRRGAMSACARDHSGDRLHNGIAGRRQARFRDRGV